MLADPLVVSEGVKGFVTLATVSLFVAINNLRFSDTIANDKERRANESKTMEERRANDLKASDAKFDAIEKKFDAKFDMIDKNFAELKDLIVAKKTRN